MIHSVYKSSFVFSQWAKKKKKKKLNLFMYLFPFLCLIHLLLYVLKKIHCKWCNAHIYSFSYAHKKRKNMSTEMYYNMEKNINIKWYSTFPACMCSSSSLKKLWIKYKGYGEITFKMLFMSSFCLSFAKSLSVYISINDNDFFLK